MEEIEVPICPQALGLEQQPARARVCPRPHVVGRKGGGMMEMSRKQGTANRKQGV